MPIGDDDVPHLARCVELARAALAAAPFTDAMKALYEQKFRR